MLYRRFGKRALDFILSLCALVALMPLLALLTAFGTVCHRGNPFFVQYRVGYRGKVIRIIKYKTMRDIRDANGDLLPDEERLTAYGRALRASSLDELPELINIIRGNMAIVGPRPLLVKYLPRYTPEQNRRHEVRPGLTGLAQINGRNTLTWEEKLCLDVRYIQNITFLGDLSIMLRTVLTVLRHDGIGSNGAGTMEEFCGTMKRTDEATDKMPDQSAGKGDGYEFKKQEAPHHGRQSGNKGACGNRQQHGNFHDCGRSEPARQGKNSGM